MTKSVNLHFSPDGGINGMAPSIKLAVVIPAHDGGLVFGSVVLQAQQYVNRVIVVDDGSTDMAKAMMAGFARARDLGYEAFVVLDGAGQHDPEEIPAMAAPVLAGEADLVISSRPLDTKADVLTYRRASQVPLNGLTNLSTDGGLR